MKQNHSFVSSLQERAEPVERAQPLTPLDPTPGPWAVGVWFGRVLGAGRHAGAHYAVMSAADQAVLGLCGQCHRSHADAQLMSAAPALADACRAMLDGSADALQLAREALQAAGLRYRDRAGVPEDRGLPDPHSEPPTAAMPVSDYPDRSGGAHG